MRKKGFKPWAFPYGRFTSGGDGMDEITLTIGRQKNIALIAHDGKKAAMMEWCEKNKNILKHHFLNGTGTTARMITDKTGLPVRGYSSGPLGGDQQIGAKIVEGRIDVVFFFSDPLTAQPHDPDVKALLRIAEVYDIPIAHNVASADFIISSPLMNQEYEHTVIDFNKNIKSRAENLL
jgi:methylglyoxal synthase